MQPKRQPRHAEEPDRMERSSSFNTLSKWSSGGSGRDAGVLTCGGEGYQKGGGRCSTGMNET
ncbi:hypothetical protein GCM10011578_024850 [Streptomyces fuscichromogenes]|uniref:Uncharacterized protein n=1 Tax=Streptomyces fuscichromogenes TaxID=1324013 RepID=A0A917XAT9_9ACTN|nr:hypothetical protein GCM10011578_024850 [Streptomyces fuscichromogenes]